MLLIGRKSCEHDFVDKISRTQSLASLEFLSAEIYRSERLSKRDFVNKTVTLPLGNVDDKIPIFVLVSFNPKRIKFIFQVGGPGQSFRNPVGLRFSFCLVGDLCQVGSDQVPQLYCRGWGT